MFIRSLNPYLLYRRHVPYYNVDSDVSGKPALVGRYETDRTRECKGFIGGSRVLYGVIHERCNPNLKNPVAATSTLLLTGTITNILRV